MRDNDQRRNHIGQVEVLELAYYVFRQQRLATSHADFSKRILGVNPMDQNGALNEVLLNRLLKAIRHYMGVNLDHPQFGTEGADRLHKGYR